MFQVHQEAGRSLYEHQRIIQWPIISRSSSSLPLFGGGHGNPLQYSCLENPHGQRNLVGYSLWGRKESDTTEGLTLSLQ